jgi:hypothetical protein
MAIRLNPSISANASREYLHTKRTVPAKDSELLTAGICCFGSPSCDWDLPVIANLGNQSDTYGNDRTDFILSVVSNSTVTANLIKIDGNGVETEYLINDSTYGVLYGLGNIKANYWGFILDWYKVADNLGFGRYKVNIVVENLSGVETLNQDSACFELMPYSCENAHRTVRIETKQSGYFEGGFDYTGLDYTLNTPLPSGLVQISRVNYWPQQIRLWGRFYREGYDFTVDNIVTEERGQEMVQSQTVKRYNLKLDTIPTSVSNRLINDLFLAPDVRISDYNIANIELYRSIRVTMTEIADPSIFTMQKNEWYDGIKFVEYKQNNVKRYR